MITYLPEIWRTLGKLKWLYVWHQNWIWFPQSRIGTEHSIGLNWLVIQILLLNAGVAYGHVLERLRGCSKMYSYGILPYNETQPRMYEMLEVNVSISSFGNKHRGVFVIKNELIIIKSTEYFQMMEHVNGMLRYPVRFLLVSEIALCTTPLRAVPLWYSTATIVDRNRWSLD